MISLDRNFIPDILFHMPSLHMTTIVQQKREYVLAHANAGGIHGIDHWDRVQKHKPISAEAVKMLRSKNLVEGRKNALIVAKSIAQATAQEADYTRAKGFSGEFCMDLIEKAVNEHDNMTRSKLELLLFPYLPDVLSESQKSSKVGYLLTKMRKDGRIHPAEGKVWTQGPEN